MRVANCSGRETLLFPRSGNMGKRERERQSEKKRNTEGWWEKLDRQKESGADLFWVYYLVNPERKYKVFEAKKTVLNQWIFHKSMLKKISNAQQHWISFCWDIYDTKHRHSKKRDPYNINFQAPRPPISQWTADSDKDRC